MGVGGRLFEVGHLKVLFRGGVVGGGGRLFEAGRLLNFSTFRVGAYSRWALIRGWALNRINTVHRIPTQSACETDCYFTVNVMDLPFASPIAICR